MQAVASKKNIAGAERLARELAHTEREIAYYLDRLDIIDDQVAQGYKDQPAHRQAFADAIASLRRRKDQLGRRQQELEKRDEKVLVFGEPEAKPMGYGRAPKFPAYNLHSVVDVDSGLIVHHDVANEANDSQLLHPMSLATMQLLEVDQLNVLADGGYSNAEAIARCERDNVEVAAPIKRGAMNTEHFRPVQFAYDEASDTIRCPAGKTLRPSGKHTRNRAIRYRTSACKTCRLKERCTPVACGPCLRRSAFPSHFGRGIGTRSRSTAVSGSTVPTQRGRHLAAIAKHGRIGWQRRSGHNRRSLAETAMYRYKTIVGRRLQARTLPN